MFAERLLPWADVHDRVGQLSRKTVWQLRRRGLFPEPVRLSAKRVAWRESDILAWVDSRSSVSVKEGPDAGR